MEWRILFRLIFLGFIAIAIWLYSKGLHNVIKSTEKRIYIPQFLHHVFGKPGTDAKHNVAGIYGQAIAILAIIAFTLLNLGQITLHDSIVIIATCITIIVVFTESFAVFQKK